MENPVPLSPEMERLKKYLSSLDERPGTTPKDIIQVAQHAVRVLPMLLPQYFYVLDFRQQRVVHAQGFQKALGYPDHEVDVALLMGYIHPSESDVVAQVAQRGIRLFMETKPVLRPLESIFTMEHRVRKASGDYIKVIEQHAVLTIDEAKDEVISKIGICTDISSLHPNHKIGWKCVGRLAELLDISDLLPDQERTKYHPSLREMMVMRQWSKEKRASRSQMI